ncbi:MAG: porphobilinogen synthase, partial [Halanaerobiales bacterium]
MIYRNRRLRKNSIIRDMTRETTLKPNDLIYPIFVIAGENIKDEISSMPGNYHWSIDRLDEIIKEVLDCGIKSILLFGIPESK